jgi:hypothetical protein
MESSEHPAEPGEAKIALAQAQAARNRMAANLVLPSFFYSSIGAAIAVQIGTAAITIEAQEPPTGGALVIGLAVFLLVAVVQLARFRRMNGVWLGGLASRVVLGTTNITSTVYAAAFAASTWAAFADARWLVVVTAAAGGAAYAWCGRRWWHSYQDDPAQPESFTAVLLIAFVIAIAGFAALLVGR